MPFRKTDKSVAQRTKLMCFWFCFFFSSRVLLKKSGCKIPRIELEDIGPSLDLVMRRTHLASDDLYKLSLKQPKALKVCTLET